MTLKLYHDALSQPCRALYIFFKTAGIPYEDKWVALRKNEHHTPEFAALNPFKKVPVLVDETPEENVVVKESCVIARYAAQKCLSPSSHWWPMDDARKSQRIDEYLHWQHINIRTSGSMVFITSIINPLKRQQPPNMANVCRFVKDLERVTDVFEKHYLDRGRFITGDEMSVADLFAICEMTQPYAAGFDMSLTRPRLAEWMADVKSQTQPHYDDAHAVVYQVHQSQGKKILRAAQAFMEEQQGQAVTSS